MSKAQLGRSVHGRYDCLVRRLSISADDKGQAAILTSDLNHGLFKSCHLGIGKDLIELVRRCPQVTFVLDHLGKPGVKDGLLDPWRGHIHELSAMDNMVCKVSGLATEADHVAWTPEQLRPYIDHVIASFGFERVMFGGDWPVSTQAIGYGQWIAVLDEALSGCSESELERFWRRNAQRVYRLG
jgi:L-fuconolactonase